MMCHACHRKSSYSDRERNVAWAHHGHEQMSSSRHVAEVDGVGNTPEGIVELHGLSPKVLRKPDRCGHTHRGKHLHYRCSTLSAFVPRLSCQKLSLGQ